MQQSLCPTGKGETSRSVIKCDGWVWGCAQRNVEEVLWEPRGGSPSDWWGRGVVTEKALEDPCPGWVLILKERHQRNTRNNARSYLREFQILPHRQCLPRNSEMSGILAWRKKSVGLGRRREATQRVIKLRALERKRGCSFIEHLLCVMQLVVLKTALW